jgi:hypothetical protein
VTSGESLISTSWWDSGKMREGEEGVGTYHIKKLMISFRAL